MEIHLSLQVGSLEAEITADSEEDYEGELVQLMDFIQSREEQLSTLGQLSVESAVATEDSIQSGTEQFDGNQKVDADPKQGESEEPTSADYSGPLSGLLRKVDASPQGVSEIVDIDPELEEPPLILCDSGHLGETVKDQQLTGSLLLLFAWKECYAESPVMVSDLKDALEHSGVSTNNLYQMYDYDVANQSLRQSGDGRGTKIRLTRVGEREAFERIDQLSE